MTSLLLLPKIIGISDILVLLETQTYIFEYFSVVGENTKEPTVIIEKFCVEAFVDNSMGQTVVSASIFSKYFSHTETFNV
jgi:hypothetical protein